MPTKNHAMPRLHFDHSNDLLELQDGDPGLDVTDDSGHAVFTVNENDSLLLPSIVQALNSHGAVVAALVDAKRWLDLFIRDNGTKTPSRYNAIEAAIRLAEEEA